MVSDYELAIERNKAANRALLASLGIEKPLFQAPSPVKKRKKTPSTSAEPSRKSARISEDKKSPLYAYVDLPASDSEYGGVKTRRSKRGRPKKAEDAVPTSTDPLIPTYVNERNAHRLNPKRYRPDPKQHGEIPGIQVGHWWETRMQCSADGVHAPPVSGISGSGSGSAYSIALSGGYEDDIDEGFRFTFTGSGGRDLSGTSKNPKNLRTAPQSSDQQLIGGNLALHNSCQSGLPVRVIRGYKATLGPPEGYRYDGLYKVVRSWCDVGMSGYKVWRFAFMRIDGQPPVDYNAGRPEDKEEDELEGAEENSSENAADSTITETTETALDKVAETVDKVTLVDTKSSATDDKENNIAPNKDTLVDTKDATIDEKQNNTASDKKEAVAAVKKNATAAVKKGATTTIRREAPTAVKKDAKVTAKKAIVAIAKEIEPAVACDNRRRSARNRS